MSEIFGLAREILLTPSIALRLGMMIGAAVILGFLLYDGYRLWLSLFFTGSVFLAFEEWMRIVISGKIDARSGTIPIIFAIMTSLIFAASVGSGMYLAYISKRERVINMRKTEKILDYLRENGKTKQPTKPHIGH